MWIVNPLGQVWFDDNVDSDSDDEELVDENTNKNKNNNNVKNNDDDDDYDDDSSTTAAVDVTAVLRRRQQASARLTLHVALRAELDGATTLRAFYCARRLAMRIPAFTVDSFVRQKKLSIRNSLKRTQRAHAVWHASRSTRSRARLHTLCNAAAARGLGR